MPMDSARRGTAINSNHDSARSSRNAMMTPPTHMIGAITRIVTDITMSSWTCWTSLVERVISDGAPNIPTSLAENVSTRCSTPPRISRPAPIAACAPKYTDADEATICTQLTAASQHRCSRCNRYRPWSPVVDDVGVETGQIERRDNRDQLEYRGHPPAGRGTGRSVRSRVINMMDEGYSAAMSRAPYLYQPCG